MDRLRTALVEVVDKGAANSRNVQLALSSVYPKVIDPRAHVMVMRALAVRRAWAITTQLRPVLQESLQHVLGQGTLEQGAEVIGSESKCGGPVGLV
eukprot:8383607-Alexandrium_andersonii.AAC.1